MSAAPQLLTVEEFDELYGSEVGISGTRLCEQLRHAQ